MDRLMFGTAGIPNCVPENDRTTVTGIEKIAELGLDCMEIEFVQNVYISESSAPEVAEASRNLKIGLTVHAPYFINLYSDDPKKLDNSKKRILKSARIGVLCGADSVVFHTAFYGSEPPEKVYPEVRKHLAEIAGTLQKEGTRIWLRPELMGKPSQFGTIDEIIRLSQEIEGILPAIDFSHWHARTGRYNTYEEFSEILHRLEAGLGKFILDNMHIHVSGIQYSTRGEQKHMNLRESDMAYPQLMKALKDFNVKGYLICESPNLEEDALLLKRTFETV